VELGITPSVSARALNLNNTIFNSKTLQSSTTLPSEPLCSYTRLTQFIAAFNPAEFQDKQHCSTSPLFGDKPPRAVLPVFFPISRPKSATLIAYAIPFVSQQQLHMSSSHSYHSNNCICHHPIRITATIAYAIPFVSQQQLHMPSHSYHSNNCICQKRAGRGVPHVLV
jgi:hypothetical protein